MLEIELTDYWIFRAYRLGYLVHYRSIFLAPFNHYIGLFLQSGLTNKWLNDALFLLQLERDDIKRAHLEETTIILNISHLQTAFYILSLGSIVSFVVLLGEIYYGRKKMKKRLGVLRNH